jgi:hypothetical protein
MEEEPINPEELLCPKAGTATSPPSETTTSQSNNLFGNKELNIVNLMLWMKRNAYEDSTIKTSYCATCKQTATPESLKKSKLT